MCKQKLLGSFASACVMLAATPAAAEGNWSFASGVEYSEGAYGLAETTTIIEVPFTAGYAGDRWSAWVTVPYVSVEGPGGIAPGGADGGGFFDNLLGNGGAAEAGATGPVSESGLGDMSAGVSYTPLRTANGSALSFSGRVRAPTGDETRALGTGEAAGSLSVAARQGFGNGAGLYGAIGYGRAFESGAQGAFAAVGAETPVAERLSLGARVNWAEADSELRRDALQAGVNAGFELNARTRIGAYASTGLTDTSPDVEAGLGVVFTP